MYMMSFLSVKIVVLFYFIPPIDCLKQQAFDRSTLRFVQSIFRHGDRNPASTFPTDLGNLESTWENGFGELTTLGIKQQYQLGQFIKKFYDGFLSKNYNAKEIHVRSTGYNRTIMSAMANLAGMYPPEGDRIWNKDLLWQPVPVHNRPRDLDPVLWMDKPCPTVGQLYRTRVFTSDEYTRIQNENAEFMEFLRQKMGRKPFQLMDMWDVFDPLYCETIHNDTHKRPEWATDEVFNRVKELHRLSITFYYNIPEVQRLRGGLMFHELASRMMEKIANKSEYIQKLKYYAYSIHDTTQIAILENMGVFDGSVPTYDQLLLLEMHEHSGDHYVKLYKRNDTTNDDVIPVSIPSCGEPCKVDKFFQLSLTKKPDDWQRECGFTKGFIADYSEELIGILVAVCILFFVLFTIVLAFYCRMRRSRWSSITNE